MANPAANYRACPCFPARSFEKKNPEGAYHWHFEGTPNFCLIKIEATRMEFLQLDGVKHIRAEKIVSDEEEAIRWIAPLTEIIFNKINKLCLEPPLGPLLGKGGDFCAINNDLNNHTQILSYFFESFERFE